MFFVKEMDQSKTNLHGMKQIPILIATDFLSAVFSSQKNFHYSQHASYPVILREAEG